MRVLIRSLDHGAQWAVGFEAFGRRRAWRLGRNPIWFFTNWRWQRSHGGR